MLTAFRGYFLLQADHAADETGGGRSLLCGVPGSNPPLCSLNGADAAPPDRRAAASAHWPPAPRRTRPVQAVIQVQALASADDLRLHPHLGPELHFVQVVEVRLQGEQRMAAGPRLSASRPMRSISASVA
jgi:hypothetical protein